MKTIPLANNKGMALVDDEDYDRLNSYSWCRTYNGYAFGNTRQGNGSRLLMHRLIMGALDHDIPSIDHIDRNKLNNQKCNLRFANSSENKGNMGLKKSNRSGYKGVYYHEKRNRWIAQIKKNYKRMCLGYYHTAEQAALAYNTAAKIHFGEFAFLNSVKPTI